MVSFRNARKLSSYLVLTKLYPFESKIGRYEACNNVTYATIISSAVNGDTFKINTSLNCDDKCLIYCVTCKQCNKQYRGKTKDQFRNNCINYKDNARKFNRKEACMQEHLCQHLQSEGHKGFPNF